MDDDTEKYLRTGEGREPTEIAVPREPHPFRKVARIVNVEGTSHTEETHAGHIHIPLHEMHALSPKTTQKFLDDTAFDLTDWLADYIADRFDRIEAEAFINGDGINKPRGFLNDPIDTALLTGLTGDSLVDLVYRVKASYRASSSFLMSSKTLGDCRKLKDGDGRFLVTSPLDATEYYRLMGYRIVEINEFPDKTIVFGSIHDAYVIAQKPYAKVIRDPFSAKPHVLFSATKDVGGDMVNSDAVRRLKY
jgi:HK97 family phage major capsid protein